MFPAIDPAAMTGTTTQTGAVRRPDVDAVVETYQTPRARDAVARDPLRVVPEQREGTAVDDADSSARAPEKTGTRVGAARTETDVRRRAAARTGDQAEINFQMSREEREVFLSAMSGRESVSEMSEEEQRLMERASERLEKLIEAADARDAASRERMDKAVKEWYLRLSNGKQPPADLLTLIRQASQGLLD